MSSSHEVCPICSNELKHIKYLAKPCKIAGGKVMSFMESVCNNVPAEPVPGQSGHLFFQVTSLYGQLLFESVQFLESDRWVGVNYLMSCSEFAYYPKADIHCITQPTPLSPPAKVERLEFKNKILELDYPNLEKIKNKMNVLVPFL
jgi:hypothetical protein